MRGQPRAGRRAATDAAMPELTLPARRRPVPTHSRLHTRRVPVVRYVAGLLLLPGLMVTGSMSAGLWASGERPATAQAGTKAAAGGAGAEAPASPADVKGSMTVQQVVDAFPPVTAAQVLAQLGAPPDTPTSTQLKTLVEGSNGADVPAVRIWLERQVAR